MEQENEFVSKKQYTFSLILIAAISVIMLLSVYSILDSKIDKQSGIEKTVTVFKDEQITEPLLEEYVIKDFNGKISVFKNNDFQYSIDVYTFTLPQADKNLLSQGIKASSQQEINDILSCYY